MNKIIIKDKYICCGNKFIGRNNNVKFEILKIYKGFNGSEYITLRDCRNGNCYEVLKGWFKYLLLDPIIEK